MDSGDALYMFPGSIFDVLEIHDTATLAGLSKSTVCIVTVLVGLATPLFCRGACNEYHCTILCIRRYRDNRESLIMDVDAEKPSLHIAPITQVITTVCSVKVSTFKTQ